MTMPKPKPLPRMRPASPVALAAALLLGALAVSAVVPGRAAEVPGFEREVRLMAREQPVDEFLGELFGKIGVPVRVDESVVGTVNGDFAKPAREVFEDITSSFQITLYYDGAVANVYPANATLRSVVYLPDALGERVMRSAREMSLPDRRNRLERTELGLVVTGTERFREQVEELADAARQGGEPAGETSPRRRVRAASVEFAPEENVYRVFRLRYAWADDTTLVVGGQEVLVPGVASLLRALVDPSAMRVMPSVTRRQLDRSLEGLRGEGLRSIGLSGGGRGASASVAEDAPLATPSAVGGPGASDARIVADSLQNAVVIRDRADRMAAYESLIAALDVEPRMIEIEATIIDLDTDRLRELGVNLRVDDEDGSVLSQGGIAPTLGSGIADVLEAPRRRGGLVSLILGDETRFLTRIRALETQGAARVVSKPHVITLANVEAVLDTSSTFFVRVEGQEEVDLFDVSVGTTLRVTPHVFESGGRAQIKLLVAIEDGATTNGRVDQIPVIRNSSINTQALIDGGESLLIGGLVRESDGNTVSKVPLLGDIPGLGALFRSTSKTSNRVERLFLISPRLSVRTPVGPRHSAPVLWGDESEIVASAPARTRLTAAALARRDAAYPLEEPLPGGGAAVDLIPRGYEPEDLAAEPRPSAVEPSLRERLLGLPPIGPVPSPDRRRVRPAPEEPWVPVPERIEVRAEPPVGLPARPPGEPTGGPERWQAVPGTAPPARAVVTAERRGRGPSAPAAVRPVAANAVPAAADDDWQEVVR